MKMYIAIPDWVPTGHAINSAAHASIACYVKFINDPNMQNWFNNYFKKVTCKVTDEEFQYLKTLDGSVVITESALGGQEVAVALAPRPEWPERVSKLKLYGGTKIYCCAADNWGGSMSVRFFENRKCVELLEEFDPATYRPGCYSPGILVSELPDNYSTLEEVLEEVRETSEDLVNFAECE